MISIKTSVVKLHKINGKRPEFDVYIGRPMKFQTWEQSVWGNPFYANLHGLDGCLRLYEEHIRECMEYEPEIYNLNELKGKRLGCWCITTDKIYPIRCHGQILMKLKEELL